MKAIHLSLCLQPADKMLFVFPQGNAPHLLKGGMVVSEVRTGTWLGHLSLPLEGRGVGGPIVRIFRTAYLKRSEQRSPKTFFPPIERFVDMSETHDPTPLPATKILVTRRKRTIYVQHIGL